MKFKISSLFLVIILLSSLTAAYFVNVKAKIPKEIIIDNSLDIKENTLRPNEPIIVTIELENKGNQKVYSSLFSKIGDKKHHSTIGILNPLESITVNIAIASTTKNSDLKLQIISTDFHNQIKSKEYDYKIKILNKQPHSSKNVILTSDEVLELGQLNDVEINIQNDLDSELEEIYVYSTFNNSGSNFIERLGKTGKIDFHLLLPPILKDRYLIPIYIYDKKKNILSQSILEFKTKIPHTDVEITNSLDDKDIVSTILNKADNIAYVDLTAHHFNNIFSSEPFDEESKKIILFPSDEETVRIQKSSKILLTTADMNGTVLYSKKLYVNKNLIYLTTAAIILLISLLLSWFLKK